MKRWILRRWWVILVVTAFLMVLPLTVAAAATPDIISILNAVTQGVLGAGKQAYCAAGVTALCV